MAVDRIFDRSEGNPFYAEELLAAGADQANVGLPSALADVLLARIEALPELAREVLKVAAVAGPRVGHRLLVAAADREETEVEWGLREAIAGQVLVANAATESYRFRHALLQEAVYGDLLPGERTRLHATYARLLVSGDPEAPSRSAAELAWHSLASHDLPGGLAALVRAAVAAVAVSAPAEAYRHLTQALELWDRVPDAAAVAGVDRVELLLRAAEAADQTGEFRRAVGLARAAVEAIDEDADPLRAAGAYERLGHHMLDDEPELGQVEPQMLEACWRAVELVPEQPPTPLRARVAAGLARALMATGDYEGARRWGEETLAVARAAGSTGDEANALMILAVQEVRFGDVGTARALLRDAAARAAAADNRPLELVARRDLAALEFDLGNLAAACAALDQAAELAQRTGLAWSSDGIDSRVLGCIAHYHAGTWDVAERVAAAVDDRPAAGPLSAAALYVEVGRGRAGATERLARLGPYRQADPYVAYLAGGCESDLALWQGDLDGASAVACATLANREQAGAPWMLSAIWPAALGLAAEGGKAERARAVGDQAAHARSLEVGRDLLARARAALQRARDRGRQVRPGGAGLAGQVRGRVDPG
jgi:tetratricopeptide (TPR) repeat protein